MLHSTEAPSPPAPPVVGAVPTDVAPHHYVAGPTPEMEPATAAEVPDVPSVLQEHLLLVRRA